MMCGVHKDDYVICQIWFVRSVGLFATVSLSPSRSIIVLSLIIPHFVLFIFLISSLSVSLYFSYLSLSLLTLSLSLFLSLSLSFFLSLILVIFLYRYLSLCSYLHYNFSSYFFFKQYQNSPTSHVTLRYSKYSPPPPTPREKKILPSSPSPTSKRKGLSRLSPEVWKGH